MTADSSWKQAVSKNGAKHNADIRRITLIPYIFIDVLYVDGGSGLCRTLNMKSSNIATEIIATFLDK